MTDGHCNRTGCEEVGTHQVWIDLYPSAGFNYDGAPAQLFFPDLMFCEKHAQELKYQDLIYEEQVAGMFHRLGRSAPDFSLAQVRNQVIQTGGAPV